MPFDQAEELFAHVGLHVLAVRGVEPWGFSSPASCLHLFWLLLVVGGTPDVTGKPTLSQGVIVGRRCMIKYILIVGRAVILLPTASVIFLMMEFGWFECLLMYMGWLSGFL